MKEKILNKFTVIKGDITACYDSLGNLIKMDAIVNVADPTLMNSIDGNTKIYEILDKINGKESYKEVIKQELDKNIIMSREDRVRCKPGTVQVTPGYHLGRYIFHTVPPEWDGGSKSCYKTLQSCYERCIDKMVEYNAPVIAMPIIDASRSDFKVGDIARIQIVAISNYLIKLKRKDPLVYSQIKKIYIVVPDENRFEVFKKILEGYLTNINQEKKSYYQTIDESYEAYIKEIQIYDNQRKGYFSFVSRLRLLLVKSSKFFFISNWFMKKYGEKNWEARRTFIEIQVFVRLMSIVLFLGLSEVIRSPLLLFFGAGIIGIYMIEILVYIMKLIFLQDIQNPSANIYRTIILISTNYLEVTLGFAYLYKIFDVIGIDAIPGATVKEALSNIITYVYFAITNSTNDMINLKGMGLVCIQSIISVYFMGIVVAYFVGNFKQRKFN